MGVFETWRNIAHPGHWPEFVLYLEAVALLILGTLTLAMALWALVSCILLPKESINSQQRLTKGFWLIILGLGCPLLFFNMHRPYYPWALMSAAFALFFLIDVKRKAKLGVEYGMD